MGVLRTKDGVRFDRITPGGFCLLSALQQVAREDGDLTITCGSEGHKPDDPHTKGQGYDVRTHDLPPARAAALPARVLSVLADGVAVPVSIGLATRHFYIQLEDQGGPNSHMHAQQRNGVMFP